MKAQINGKLLLCRSEPIYFRVTLGRSLSYRCHLESLHKKLTSRITLLKTTDWNKLKAGADSLRMETPSLLHPDAEHCTSAWSYSAYIHLVDVYIRNVLRTVAGCLSFTPANYQPIFAGIQPVQLRRRVATLGLSRRAKDPDHLLYPKLLLSSPETQVKSVPWTQVKPPFRRASLRLMKLANHDNSIAHFDKPSTKQQMEHLCKQISRFHYHSVTRPAEIFLKPPLWVKLNRMQIPGS